MLDIKLIRESASVVKANLSKRNDDNLLKMVDEVAEKDKKYREVLKNIEKFKNRRNVLSEEIAKLKVDGKDAKDKLKEASEIPKQIKKLEAENVKLKENINPLLFKIPNLLHSSVPYGKDESENVEVRTVGKAPKFSFKPKSHLEILEDLGLLDRTTAAKVSGSGFLFLKGNLVLLDLAIQRFAIDFLSKRGFQIMSPSLMINKRVYEAMIGDPSDFAEASYKIDGEELYLIPTAEYPLGGIFTDEVLDVKDLPIRLCGVSPCFRKEVGTHGKYSKGLFRIHHFNKVEQFVFCLPKDSWDLHEEIQKNAENLYKELGLHFRTVNVCTGDIGTKAAKKYDIEGWMADGKFRELGSNSNCTDYQARRLNIRFREKEGQPPKGLVHTLNNTALATSRTIIVIVEQFQQKDGSVKIPKVLWPYMNGIKVLKKA